ncbi:MAG TPA: hypothetical protein VFY40_21465 [Blastocatellia bacterium]|nr:hypothetical protein [Blastocatellia bacterium]
MMKHLEETTSRRALLAMALSGYGAMAFPINIKQDKTSQDANVEAAKRFVGTWKGKSRPDMIADDVLIFKMEGERLKGTERQFLIRDEGDGRGPQLVRDEYVPLPDLNVEGKTLTWKTKWMQSDQESLKRVTLISDDEILFEGVGMQRSSDQPTLIVPISYKLKKEK